VELKAESQSAMDIWSAGAMGFFSGRLAAREGWMSANPRLFASGG
jgi:hypothetical protein